jgi:hypothetical protein
MSECLQLEFRKNLFNAVLQAEEILWKTGVPEGPWPVL